MGRGKPRRRSAAWAGASQGRTGSPGSILAGEPGRRSRGGRSESVLSRRRVVSSQGSSSLRGTVPALVFHRIMGGAVSTRGVREGLRAGPGSQRWQATPGRGFHRLSPLERAGSESDWRTALVRSRSSPRRGRKAVEGSPGDRRDGSPGSLAPWSGVHRGGRRAGEWFLRTLETVRVEDFGPFLGCRGNRGGFGSGRLRDLAVQGSGRFRERAVSAPKRGRLVRLAPGTGSVGWRSSGCTLAGVRPGSFTFQGLGSWSRGCFRTLVARSLAPHRENRRSPLARRSTGGAVPPPCCQDRRGAAVARPRREAGWPWFRTRRG